jgi:hypothetical protein
MAAPYADCDIGPETAAHMAVACDRVRRETGLPIGVNMLANAALHALAVASASRARFVRVNQWANAYVANERLIDGAAGPAMRYRRELGAQDVRVFTDAHVKHGAHAIVVSSTPRPPRSAMRSPRRRPFASGAISRLISTA